MAGKPRHGQSTRQKETRAHAAWHSMRNRCLNQRHRDYQSYGGRGITVCERWNTFEAFFEDMGHPPEGTSLDRRDNDGGYSKENCRWATAREQTLNRRCTAWVEVNGEKHRVRDIEVSLGLSSGALWHRLKKGWSLADACSIPKLGRTS